MRAVVTLELVIPPELGDPDEFRRELRELVATVEAEHATARARTGVRVLGRRGVLRQSWRGRPSSHEPRRTLSPRVAFKNKWARIEALQRNATFVAAYRAPRALWCTGLTATFPAGTYWLHRSCNVTAAPLPAGH